MNKLLIALLLIPAMAAAQRDTIRHQVKVDSVLEVKNGEAHLRGVDMHGKVVFLKYGWHQGLARKFTKDHFLGRWFTVDMVSVDKRRGIYTLARVHPNQ